MRQDEPTPVLADQQDIRRTREDERLNVGWFTAAAGIFRAGDDMDRTIRYPVLAYVIETETERILIDTGLNPAAIADPAAYYDRPDVFAVSTPEQEQSVADQLDVGTLTKVVLTHLHWDHVGGLRLIPASVSVVIQRAEWEAGHDDAAVQRNFFLPRDYAEDSREVILIDGDHDLLGDGSIELMLTPGHTPGHSPSVSVTSCSASMSHTSHRVWTTTAFRSSPTITSSRDAPPNACAQCVTPASP